MCLEEKWHCLSVVSSLEVAEEDHRNHQSSEKERREKEKEGEKGGEIGRERE